MAADGSELVVDIDTAFDEISRSEGEAVPALKADLRVLAGSLLKVCAKPNFFNELHGLVHARERFLKEALEWNPYALDDDVLERLLPRIAAVADGVEEYAELLPEAVHESEGMKNPELLLGDLRAAGKSLEDFQVRARAAARSHPSSSPPRSPVPAPFRGSEHLRSPRWPTRASLASTPVGSRCSCAPRAPDWLRTRRSWRSPSRGPQPRGLCTGPPWRTCSAA